MELLHAAFHEPRHYQQHLYFLKEIDLPDNDRLVKLDNDERKLVFQELLNAGTNKALYLTESGEVDTFDFFYYPKFHEVDAVRTFKENIYNVLENIDPITAGKIESGLELSNNYWKNVYEYFVPFIAKQKDYGKYETKGSMFGLRNKKIEADIDEIVSIAMHEYLPISKAITEYNVLKINGMNCKNISIDDINVEFSVNNDSWFLKVKVPTIYGDTEFETLIKDNTCTFYRTDTTSELEKDIKIFENIFDITKAFAKVYSERNDRIVNKYKITPLVGIYSESQRMKLFSSIAKLEGLKYENEPNEIFVKSNFNTTLKTPYVSRYIDQINDFIDTCENLDTKIDMYKNIQLTAACKIPIEIENIR